MIIEAGDEIRIVDYKMHPDGPRMDVKERGDFE
jgi:hypothetical protein